MHSYSFLEEKNDKFTQRHMQGKLFCDSHMIADSIIYGIFNHVLLEFASKAYGLWTFFFVYFEHNMF